jgi:hypothetical protein
MLKIMRNLKRSIGGTNELDSLGIKQKESNKGQELENLTDDIKQKFIYDYKACYSE